MRAGNMDRRITIRRFSVTGDDGYGNQIEAWADHATVWAEVRQSAGKEFMEAGRIGDERKVVFRIRFMAALTVADRVAYQGAEHDTVEIRELGRKQGIELHTFKRA